MSVVLIGSIRANRLLEQPESELVVGHTGIATATEVYECQWKDALRLTSALRRHPEFTWLEKVNSKIVRQPADIARITVFFEGLGSGSASTGGEVNATYELEVATSTEPVITHKRYESLSISEKAKIKKVVAEWEREGVQPAAYASLSDLGKELVEKILKFGIEYYVSPAVVWKQTITKALSELSAEQLNKVGDIDTPPGPVPQIASGRNWLRLGSTQSIRGSAIQITHSWRLSGRRGWDPQLYTTV